MTLLRRLTQRVTASTPAAWRQSVPLTPKLQHAIDATCRRHIWSRVRNISPSTWATKSAPRRASMVVIPHAPQPWPRRRSQRLLIRLLALYVGWKVFDYVIIEPFLDWADDEWETMSESEKKQVEELSDDEPWLFLPFPWSKRVELQPPWNRRDPDFRELVKLVQDVKAGNEIKGKLVELTKTFVAKSQVGHFFKNGRIMATRTWLNISLPSRPPPEHFVSGILVDDEGIAWAERPIEPATYSSLDDVIYPKAIALGTWAFISTLWSNTFSSAPVHGAETWWREVAPGQLGLPNPAANSSNPVGRPTANPIIIAPTQPQETANATDEVEQGLQRIKDYLMPAFLNAGATYMRNKRPKQTVIERGCCLIDGMIELESSGITMVMYVEAAYNLKTRKFVQVQHRVKHVGRKPAKMQPKELEGPDKSGDGSSGSAPE